MSQQLTADWVEGVLVQGAHTLEGDSNRPKITVSDADAKRYFDGPDSEHGIIVTDLETGERMVIRNADCGSGCRCAMEIVWMEKPRGHAVWVKHNEQVLATSESNQVS